MRGAKRTIDDLTMGVSAPSTTSASAQAFKKYVETIAAVCQKRAIAYREIIYFPPVVHLERAESMLRKNLFGYRLRYYEFSREDIPPLLQFMVIDQEEVILGSYRGLNLPIVSSGYTELI